MARTPDLNFGLALMPYDASQVDGPQNWIGGFTLVMSAGAKDPDAAWEFIRYATADPEGTLIYALATGSFPGYRASPAFRELGRDRIAAQFLQILQGARHARPPIPNQAYYHNELNGRIFEALRGQKPSRQVLDEITRIVQANLDEILGRRGRE